MLSTFFYNAQAAFEYYYDLINKEKDINGTKSLYNVGFYINNPKLRDITTPWRKWSKLYADKEWQWYLSKDRSVKEIGKHAKIWMQVADENGLVNSNYGWQWNRNDQLGKIIKLLKEDSNTRRASVSIYDGKEIDTFGKDVPCTYAINFRIDNEFLHMSVLMRSNDLVYGFCNDQYCFSKLQELVSQEVGKEIGTYFHFSNNLHIYERHYQTQPNQPVT